MASICFFAKNIGLGPIRDCLGIGINFFYTLGFIFPFALGVIAKKYNWVEVIRSFFDRCRDWVNLVLWLVLMIIAAIRMFIPNQMLQPFCMLVLVLIFPVLHLSKWIRLILSYLGKHSMNIWLIHTWICYYLFKDFIYSLKYPILIFSITTILSLLMSLVVNEICDCIQKIAKKQKTTKGDIGRI